jgi:hypothetical protein
LKDGEYRGSGPRLASAIVQPLVQIALAYVEIDRLGGLDLGMH